MHEELLEDIAQRNGLREVSPYVKLAAALGGILLCLLSAGPVAPLAIALLLSGGILLLARVDLRTYGELFVAPFSFALMSVSAIILLSGGGAGFWSWTPLPWLSLSLTRAGINEGVLVLSRMTGGMSALIFLAVTTPMTDLFLVMRQCRVPGPVVDLAMMIYRAIFLIMDQLVQTYQAQQMRLGYSSFLESLRSLSTLCGSVFIGSWLAGEDLVRAMDARCYSGKFAVAGRIRPVGMVPLLAVGLFLLVSAAMVVFAGDFSIFPEPP
ncbi:MAG: cobalt ECF transporter T component CbiQ [Methanomicrobiales archaeon]|nr:cobalt ECF transporter T component CbiQ [Methanomicrobiales archaeon]